MRNALVLAAAVGAMTVTGSAFADDAAGLELSPQYHQCAAQFGGKFGAALDCIDAEKSRQDEKLRRNDQLILSRLSPSGQAEFEKNHQLWWRVGIMPCQGLLSPASAPSPQSAIDANACAMKERAARVVWTEMVLKGDFGPLSDLFSPGKIDELMR